MSGDTTTIKRIGELNGTWAGLFKFVQILIPVLGISLVPWAIYVTGNLHSLDVRTTKIESWMSLGPRFTPADADALRMKILSEVKIQADANNAAILQKLDQLEAVIVDLKVQLAKRP